jgi:putative Ca2+/H+ antiporter (TMEM165/GDT1 family)
MHFLLPFLASLLIIGIAELGDKTQLLTLTLAAKYPMEKVIYGISSAAAVLMFIAVVLGKVIQRFIPMIIISILACAFFIIYGLMILAPVPKENEKKVSDESAVKSKDPFWIIFGCFFMAEMGDKTQLAAFALTAKYGSPFQIWLGATLALILANLFGLLIGNVLRNYMPERIIRYLTGIIFIAFGAITFLGLILKI